MDSAGQRCDQGDCGGIIRIRGIENLRMQIEYLRKNQWPGLDGEGGEPKRDIEPGAD